MEERKELDFCLVKKDHILEKLCKVANLQKRNLVSENLKLNLYLKKIVFLLYFLFKLLMI